MNAELQKLRQYWQTLPNEIKARKTGQNYLRAIQIAEARDNAVDAATKLHTEIASRFGSPYEMGNELREVMTAMKSALARVANEGE